MATWTTINASATLSSVRADAEYFQPTYLQALDRLSKCTREKLGRLAVITDGIHESPQVTEDGVRYISAKCVKDNEFALEAVFKFPGGKTARTQGLN